MSLELQALPLIERIYEAAVEPTRWQAFTDALREVLGGDVAVGFALQLPGFPNATAIYTTGFGESNRDAFARHVAQGLPWEEARQSSFVGRFGRANAVFPDEAVADTDFYREALKPMGLAALCPIGHTIALEGSRPVASVAVFRLEGGLPFSDADLALPDLLVPHLARAYRIHSRMKENAALAEALDRLPTGVVLLDSAGRRVLANRAAERILTLDDGLSIGPEGPRCARPGDDAVLQSILTRAGRSTSAGQVREGAVMAVARPSGQRPFPLMVTPLLQGPSDGTLGDAATVLYVSDIERSPLEHRETLRRLYALTEAESELVSLLCEGRTLEEAAERRGVTLNTARSQLKQVFAKTNTSRQSELVRLVLAGIAPIGDP